MFVQVNEKCGVVAVIDTTGRNRNVAPIAVSIDEGLQHRGQLGAGLASIESGVRGATFNILKNNGCVSDVLCTAACGKACKGSSAIAHTRYATCGSDDSELAQPYTAPGYAFAFNGNWANYPEIAERLKDAGVSLEHDVDTAVIQQIITDVTERSVHNDVFDILATVQRKADGSCNLVMVDDKGSITAYRDKHGFRPLSYTEHDGFVAVASEDSAIKKVWKDALTTDIQPGQALHVDANTLKAQLMRIADPQLSRCFFEWIYFANYRSTIDKVAVAEARFHMGCLLAEREDVEFPQGTVVVPVPKSAKLAAFGYANAMGLEYMEGITINKDDKGQDVGRTFIEAGGRLERAKRKYRLEESLSNKHLILVEDSTVRGTTMDSLVQRLWNEVAPQSIHVRFACPPILNICPYGIDIKTKSELIARKIADSNLYEGTLSLPMQQELARMLSVQTLRYASLYDVPKALHFPESELCLACINGKYPTQFEQKRNDEAL